MTFIHFLNILLLLNKVECIIIFSNTKSTTIICACVLEDCHHYVMMLVLEEQGLNFVE